VDIVRDAPAVAAENGVQFCTVSTGSGGISGAEKEIWCGLGPSLHLDKWDDRLL
jgi:hypothetical protein